MTDVRKIIEATKLSRQASGEHTFILCRRFIFAFMSNAPNESGALPSETCAVAPAHFVMPHRVR